MGCINYGTAPIEVEKQEQVKPDTENKEHQNNDAAEES